MSYEYLCHVAIPSTLAISTQWCNLTNYNSVFTSLQNSNNNIVRINAIFNSSPGISQSNTVNKVVVPFADEELFPWTLNASGAVVWNLSETDPNFLPNLEQVVCTAYTKGLVVEVTLFDPWNPNWASSPFNGCITATADASLCPAYPGCQNAMPPNCPACQVGTNPSCGPGSQCQGFTCQQYFASFDTPASKTDTIPQNISTRSFQVAAMKAVVNRLKKYPNIIWEIANEPDFIPSSLTTIADVVAWEEYMAGQLLDVDSQHLVMMNGHNADSFAWNVVTDIPPPNSSFLNDSNTIQTAHYPHINSSSLAGAIDINRNSGLASDTSKWQLGFTENQSLPNVSFPQRSADDVRAEAWEFIMGGGGLFNGYSYNFSTPSITASQQLPQIFSLLFAPIRDGGSPGPYLDLAGLAPATCGSGSWCSGVPTWGAQDRNGNCGAQNGNAYWSTISTSTGYTSILYIHHGEYLSQEYPGSPPKFDGYHELPCVNDYSTPLTVTAPFTGCWYINWVDPKTGVYLGQWVGEIGGGAAFSPPTLPFYEDDVAVVFAWDGPSGPDGSCLYLK